MPHSIAFLYDGYLVGLFNYSISKNYQSIQNWIGDITFVAGLSNSFTNLNQLHYHFIEARSAIQFSDKGTNTVAIFNEHLIPYILHHCTGELPSLNLYPQGLLNVIHYNETSSVDYIDTLKIWLEEGLNDTRSAARLFISRNSFLSRRDRILVLLEDNLDNPDRRFQLYFCVRLYLKSFEN